MPERSIVKSRQIGIRLGIAFGVLVSILMGVGYLGLSRMDQISANFNEILGKHWTKLRLTRDALGYSNRNSRITMEILLLRDSNQIDPLLSERAENTKRISELIAQIESRCETDHERQLLATVKQLRTTYIESYLRTLHLLIDEGQRDAAAAVMVEEVLPALFKYHAAWNDFFQFQMDQLDVAAGQSRVHNVTTRRFVLLLIVLAGIAAVSIAMMVTRNMVQEMKARIRAEQQASKLNVELEQRVMHRTSELADANQRLTGEIEERKQAEEQLNLQTAALRAAANAIIITDREGTILWVNPAFTELTGYRPEESIGQNPRMLKSFEHDHSFYTSLWSTIKSGQVWRGEIRNRKKDGSLYTEETTITPVRSPSGQITNFIGIKQDVTQKKQLEAQYRQAQKMEAVGRLAGGVAHDFNNLLAVIAGYSELSLDKLESEHPVAKDLVRIKAAAGRAASLTKQLLAFSRQQIFYPRIIGVNAIVENMGDMLRRLVGDDVEIIVKPGIPLGSIKADVGQLEQVLMNLVVNARDAMPDGGQITIETCDVELDETYQRGHEPVQPGQYVMLSISDSGCGMDETTKTRIFDPFFTTKAPGKGTGLGLSTVYGIVKQSAGYIWVYSEPGKGTAFKLYFPRVSEVAEAITRPAAVAGTRGGSETILLVEDDEDLRELIALVLRNVGYTVLEAGDAQKALEAAAKHKGTVHVLLSDVVMPQTNGVQLFKLLRAGAPELKVILMSGYAVEMLVRQAPIPPDVTFIEKPFTRNSLLLTIQAVLRGQQTIKDCHATLSRSRR